VTFSGDFKVTSVLFCFFFTNYAIINQSIRAMLCYAISLLMDAVQGLIMLIHCGDTIENHCFNYAWKSCFLYIKNL